MTKQKKSMSGPAKPLPTPPGVKRVVSGVVNTQTAAARAMGVTTKTISRWKAEGDSDAGFRPDGGVDLDVLVKWLEKRKEENSMPGSIRDEKTLEEIRKLRLANDQKEGRLVERAWVAGRVQSMFGDVNSFRSKSEAEHATKFAAAAGDEALCRTIVRGIWDQIMINLQSLHKHLEEGPTA